MKTLLTTGTVLCTALALTFASCKKDAKSNDQSSANLEANSQTAAGLYDDVFSVNANVSVAKGVASNSAASRIRTNSVETNSADCATYSVTFSDDTFPVTITVDFGTGCTGWNGVTRSGKITSVYSNFLFVSGSVVTTTFDHYTVNGYGLDGTYTLTNTSTENGLSWNSRVTGGQVTYPDGALYSFAGIRYVTETAGASTPFDFSDDIYSITGSHTYANSLGETVTDSVITPLVKANSCFWVSKGTIGFTANGVSGTLDFGDGTCDDQATIKAGSYSGTVKL